jgi:DNA methylase
MLSPTGSLLLNGVCPYYTMYPIEFPLRVLGRNAGPGQWVLDPFCGRGTTLFAARSLGLPSVGVDSSPIAAAIASAKLATTTPAQVVAAVRHILDRADAPCEIPKGEFWRRAYHADTLVTLCKLREALLAQCTSASRIVARAIILGCLHGPLGKTRPRYFSNQCPRTFAPKPAYSVRYWKREKLKPQPVDTLELIHRKAEHYLEGLPAATEGEAVRADSRQADAIPKGRRFDWVVSSPPYYGMRTYIPDQWLRFWFLGGPSEVAYQFDEQLRHLSPEVFTSELASVWKNTASRCADGAKLVVRFGGINDRKQEPVELLTGSLEQAGWRIQTARAAGDANTGKRQADQFATEQKKPIAEYDVYAVWKG